MRIRIIHTVLLGAALLLLASCTKDELKPEINSDGNPQGYLVETLESETYYDIEDFLKYICANGLGDRLGLSAGIMELYYSGELAKLAARNYIDVGLNPDGSRRLQFERHSFSYRSTDSQGKPVVLSGIAVFPNNVEGSDRDYELDNITLFSTYHIDLSGDCPSLKGSQVMLRTIFNSMVVIPDFQGYGVSADMRHPYLEFNTLARQAVDCELAALELAKGLGVTTCKSYGTFNMGVSKGGATALAVHKYLETKASDSVRNVVRLKSTYCSSGLFDAAGMLRSEAEQRSIGSPWFPAMLVSSSFNANRDLFESYEVADFMSNGFNSFHTNINGENYSLMSMMESKRFTSDEIARKYRTNGFTSARQILSNRLLNGSGVNVEDELYAKIKQISEKNNPMLGWDPDEAPILIEHSKMDDFVPFETTFSSYEKLKYMDDGTPNDLVEFKTTYIASHILSTADGVLRMITHKDPAEKD